jgi:putative toxin-antitoxin system antitoxin component (TIGR02293 family)
LDGQTVSAPRAHREKYERQARLARVKAFALDIWGSDSEAQRFLSTRHALLGGRTPREVAANSEDGANKVEQLLGGLIYGTAM